MANYALTTGVNNITGTASADTFSGPGGNVDTLLGLGGADTFTIDQYQMGTIDGGTEIDTVVETDNAFSAALTFQNVENLQLTSTITNFSSTAAQLSAFSSIGVATNPADFYFFLQGNGGTIDFSSRFVTSTLLHVQANNADAGVSITGTAHADDFIGSIYADKLYGGGDADTMSGLGGKDILDGGVGADTMEGGADDDTYYVDNAGDIVDESGAGGSGVDAVRSSNLSINLADAIHFIGGVENVFLGGALNLTATGNDLDNRLYGNDGINTLVGGIGNDTLVGGVGADSMNGGVGNDAFYVDNAGDKVIEAVGGGSDTVFASLTYKLTAGAEVEVLRTTNQAGTDAINFTGSDYANTIRGNAGTNTIDGRDGIDKLYGYEGADILKGGLGNDVLYGGAENDSFVFNTTLSINNVDTIADFGTVSGNDDMIVLDDAVFVGLTTAALASGAFVSNATGLASDADDRIIYNSSNGKLYYDADGNGSGEDAVQFATLAGHPTLTAADFLVV